MATIQLPKLWIIIQVCIPGLHLSLGIFNRIWTLLEEACIEMDFKLAEAGGGGGSSSFNTYYESTLGRRSTLKLELETQQSYVAHIDEMITYTTLMMPGADDSDFLDGMREEATATHSRIHTMVQYMQTTKNSSLINNISL
jgi:hypothetical protein